MINMSNDEITNIWEAMPGQPGGWLKEFGYIQFARAIEAEVAERYSAQAGITSLEGLTRYGVGGSGDLEEMVCGDAYLVADVERLLATQAQAAAPATDERALFEAAFSDYPNDRNMPDKTYNSPFLHVAWQGWQARAAIAHPAAAVEPAVEQAEPAQAGIPADVRAALDRMCQPLHESRLSGATAQEDARCMDIIKRYIEQAAPASLEQAKSEHTQFETWATKAMYVLDWNDEGHYESGDTESAWDGWKSRASLAAPIAAAPSAPEQEEVRNQALEEAANVCMVGAVAAREIRKLKTAGSPTATAAARDVLAERRRQVDREERTHEDDDAYVQGELGAYAAFYAMPPGAREWPAEETGYGATWGEAIIPADWTPPKPGDRRREMVKAGALILAEIERLDRDSMKTATNEGGASNG